MPWDPAPLQAVLATSLPDATEEAERLFALGWLGWLAGNPAAAEPLLAEAVRRACAAGELTLLAQAAYWCARLRLRQRRMEALTEYEAVLRMLGGSPQATVWFVDLQGRSGKVERAEHVWKSLRSNRKISACPEGPLLEARFLLPRGEMAAAERVLLEAVPASGVVWVERLLLLAWAAFNSRQAERGRALLEQARTGPYPAAALNTWARLCERHEKGEAVAVGEVAVPPGLDDFLRGQEARLAGETAAAIAAYRDALATPAQPFARYGLACLGQDDPAAVLAAQPGFFLAVRCRLRQALDRFRRRQSTPGEFLDAFQQAAAAGYRNPAAKHFRRLALALQQRQPTRDCLRTLAAEEGPRAGDSMRVALELAVRRLTASEALPLLLEWVDEGGPAAMVGLGAEVGRQLLRLMLRGEATPQALDAARRLIANEPLLALMESSCQSAVTEVSTLASVRLLELARETSSAVKQSWREEVAGLLIHERLKSLAQALLLHAAARRQDVAAVASLLEEVDLWRRFGSGPPRFVVQALAAVVAVHPAHAGLRQALAGWLPLWDEAALGPDGAALGPQSRLAAGPPPGVAAPAWFLHQASQALRREDARQALSLVRQAQEASPDLAAPDNASPEARAVREALPELERRARAQFLAAITTAPASPPSPALLVDAVDLLAVVPQGLALLEAAERGDTSAAHQDLDALVADPDLSPRLAHHLALLTRRAAQALEGRGREIEADDAWRRSWRCWLHFLAAPADADGPPSEEARGLVLEELLAAHRHQLTRLLSREAMESARRLWSLVQQLPTLAPEGPLREEVTSRVARFREELATEFLLATREAMYYGDIPEGWRADYEKGLAWLRRLLSLDRDNPRLLTALLEQCGEWFFDLYRLGDWQTLRQQVDRFTPFALQLARLAESRPGDLAARATLAGYWKFRGFICRDCQQQQALYREALEFNPADDNVRQLLAELGSSEGEL
jgi:hypothetical protein